MATLGLEPSGACQLYPCKPQGLRYPDQETHTSPGDASVSQASASHTKEKTGGQRGWSLVRGLLTHEGLTAMPQRECKSVGVQTRGTRD